MRGVPDLQSPRPASSTQGPASTNSAKAPTPPSPTEPAWLRATTCATIDPVAHEVVGTSGTIVVARLLAALAAGLVGCGSISIENVGSGTSASTTSGRSTAASTATGATATTGTSATTGTTSTTGSSGAGGASAGPSQLCVDTINEHRASLNLPPYQRWTASEPCADGQAQSDSQTGTAHGAFGQCGERAQNECPGWPAPADKMIVGCLQSMWDEGPGDFSGHGHFINMSSTMYTEVACGFYTTPSGRIWSVQDFR